MLECSLPCYMVYVVQIALFKGGEMAPKTLEIKALP
jgi:hypothetical protein